MRYRIYFDGEMPTCEIECWRFEFRTPSRLMLYTRDAKHKEDCCDVLFPRPIERIADDHGRPVWPNSAELAASVIATASRRERGGKHGG
jgi:hypothetical protein